MATVFLLVSVLAMVASESPALGEPFSLRVGESLSIKGTDLRLRFAGVTSDSRCPMDVDCIVAGEANVVVEAVREAESVELLFRVPPAGGHTQKLARFTVTITALEPQTVSTRRIETSDYVATMVVTAESR